MKQSVKRVILTGNWQAVTFEKKAKHYFVKNFSDNDIFVSFAENDSEDTSFKIKSGFGEEVAITFYQVDNKFYKTNVIYVKGTGEVEIQQLDVRV